MPSLEFFINLVLYIDNILARIFSIYKFDDFLSSYKEKLLSVPNLYFKTLAEK